MAKSRIFPVPTGELVPFPQSGDVLRAVMENAPIGMSLVSAEGRVIYANQAFADMFRRSRQDCLGLTARDLVAPGMADRATDQLRGLATGEADSYRVERLYQRGDGSTFWGLASASAVRRDGAGAPLFIIIQVIDIDLQKRADATIAEAESRWNFALESAGQGVWDHDLRTGKSFYSRMWKMMRGMDPDAPVEDTQEIWLARVHPDDRAYAREEERRLANRAGRVSGVRVSRTPSRRPLDLDPEPRPAGRMAAGRLRRARHRHRHRRDPDQGHRDPACPCADHHGGRSCAL